MSRYTLIGCGLAGSTIAESLAKRNPEHMDLFAQFITADADSNEFTKEIAIPNTSRGSGKSYYDASGHILKETKAFFRKNSLFSSIKNQTVVVIVALGGGSGNAIKDEVCSILLRPRMNNKVILVPILPMNQEGIAAASNATYGLKGVADFITGDERTLTVIPLSLEAAKEHLNTKDIHKMQKRIETLLTSILLFTEDYIRPNTTSSFTIDSAEYDSVLLGSYHTFGSAKRHARHGFGVLAYNFMNIPEADEEPTLFPFDFVTPGLAPELAIEGATDVVITIALNSFVNQQKVKTCETHLLEYQEQIQKINPNLRIIAGITQSPTGRDHVIIMAAGSDLTNITDYYYAHASASFSKRSASINKSKKSVKKVLANYDKHLERI